MNERPGVGPEVPARRDASREVMPGMGATDGGWLARLPAPLLGVVGLVVAAGVGAGGYYAFRTYDYVQHDNDFCMSCHLMREPYELFAESAHQGLGCKACHQPTFLARSQMAFTQILENPEELTVHADVPNERCAGCHIEGDPEKWLLVANTAGHRVHFESRDPALSGLQCVECHATSIHEFAPTDRTCSRSGCHEDNTIRLGRMSDLTIHCAACHGFVAPVDGARPEPAELERAILPDRDECLSCHAMRELAQMPEPDPHEGVCASCHNPHVQTEPREAAAACAGSGCHARADTLTPFHRGLQPGALERCLDCHGAHDFSVDGENCLACHQGVLEDGATRFDSIRPGARNPHRTGAGMRSGDGLPGGGPSDLPVAWAAAIEPAAWWSHPRQERAAEPFRHGAHRAVACTSCHDNRTRHGEVKVLTLSDCRSCHHAEPLAADCTRCHEAGDAPERSFPAARTVDFSVSDPGERTFAFRHAPHEELECVRCHTGGLGRSAAAVECAGCHEEHHAPANDCAACHAEAPASAHPVSDAHVTCSGAGCHTPAPFEDVPRTRPSCVVCHREQRDHMAGRECADCHTLPDAVSRGGAGAMSAPSADSGLAGGHAPR